MVPWVMFSERKSPARESLRLPPPSFARLPTNPPCFAFDLPYPAIGYSFTLRLGMILFSGIAISSRGAEWKGERWIAPVAAPSPVRSLLGRRRDLGLGARNRFRVGSGYFLCFLRRFITSFFMIVILLVK